MPYDFEGIEKTGMLKCCIGVIVFGVWKIFC